MTKSMVKLSLHLKGTKLKSLVNALYVPIPQTLSFRCQQPQNCSFGENNGQGNEILMLDETVVFFAPKGSSETITFVQVCPLTVTPLTVTFCLQ